MSEVEERTFIERNVAKFMATYGDELVVYSPKYESRLTATPIEVPHDHIEKQTVCFRSVPVTIGCPPFDELRQREYIITMDGEPVWATTIGYLNREIRPLYRKVLTDEA